MRNIYLEWGNKRGWRCCRWKNAHYDWRGEETGRRIRKYVAPRLTAIYFVSRGVNLTLWLFIKLAIGNQITYSFCARLATQTLLCVWKAQTVYLSRLWHLDYLLLLYILRLRKFTIGSSGLLKYLADVLFPSSIWQICIWRRFVGSFRPTRRMGWACTRLLTGTRTLKNCVEMLLFWCL